VPISKRSSDVDGCAKELQLGPLERAALDLVRAVQATLLSKDAILIDFPLETIARVLSLIDPTSKPRYSAG
jgi:hypothetical protein